MSKLPISVHILTWNSGQTLERALHSVEQCAEIIVLDGGSTDDTISIAERFGARVLPQRFPGAQGKPLDDFGAARNVALDAAVQPWILSLDSDEELSKEGLAEIRTIVKGNEPAAYLVPRKYVLQDGTVVERASTYPNLRVYFFHRDAVGRWQKPVHERIAVKPGMPLRRLKNGSLAPLQPVSVFRNKLAQYLRIEVAASRGKGFGHWVTKRLLHTLRSRAVATVRLLGIWLIPGKRARLPMEYERARFWYAWKLIVMTFPRSEPRA